MTSEQIQYVLEMAQRNDERLDYLAEVFPEVDWVAAEVERREAAAERPSPAVSEKAADTDKVNAILKDIYVGGVSEQLGGAYRITMSPQTVAALTGAGAITGYTISTSTGGTYNEITRSTEPMKKG